MNLFKLITLKISNFNNFKLNCGIIIAFKNYNIIEAIYNIIKLKPKFWIIDMNEFSFNSLENREIIWTLKRLMTEKRMGKSSTAKVWSDPLPASNWVVGDLRKFTDDRIVYTCELTSNNDYIVTKKQRMYEL